MSIDDKKEQANLLKELYAGPKHIREYEICEILIQKFDTQNLTHEGKTYIQDGQYIQEPRTQKKKYDWIKIDPQIEQLQEAGYKISAIAEKTKVAYDSLWAHLKNKKARATKKTPDESYSSQVKKIPLPGGRNITLKVNVTKEDTQVEIIIPGER
jgi:hypothetical protein